MLDSYPFPIPIFVFITSHGVDHIDVLIITLAIGCLYGFLRYELIYPRLRLTDRGAELHRRYGRLGATSLLSPG